MTTLEEYTAGQRDEWLTFVAVQPIFIDGVRAFNEDDAVPVSHVTRGIVKLGEVRDVTIPVPGEPAMTVFRPPIGTLEQPTESDGE
jgi:hypothetical protein